MPDQKPAERAHDDALADSFPASDPPASSGIAGPGESDKPAHQRDTADKPTGTPTSDRHAAETAHHDESETHGSSGSS